MDDRKNTSDELMQYFGLTDIREFRDFWYSLTVEEQLYYRYVDLTS